MASLSGPKYRAEIDGLRAVALLPVLFFHAGFKLFAGGYVGVDVFFVISGYLITTIILAELRGESFSLRGFYERRARRILPASFFVFCVIMVPSWLVMLPGQLKNFGQSLIAVALFSSNILFWRTTGYFESTAEMKPLIHTWSLGLEEQFYIFYPFLLLLLWRLARKHILLVLTLAFVISLALSQYFALRNPSVAFYLLPLRAWELLAGGILSAYLSSQPGSDKFSVTIRNIFSTTGLLMIVGAILTFSETTAFPGLMALLPVVGSVLIIMFANRETFVGRLLSLRFFVGVGLVSYSAYLWHQPLFALLRLVRLTDPAPLEYVIAIALTFLISYVSWSRIEKPYREKNRVSAARLWMLSLVGTLAILAVGLILHFSHGLEEWASPEVRQISRLATTMNPRLRECDEGPGHERPISAACTLGDQQAKPTIALFGDSHADALFATIDEGLQKKGLSAKYFTYPTCPPILNLTLRDAPAEHHCQQHNLAVAKFLSDSQEISTVIIASRWSLYFEGPRFDNGEGSRETGAAVPASTVDVVSKTESERKQGVAKAYRTGIERWLGKGKKVILIYPTPEAGWDVPMYLGKAFRIYGSALVPELGSTSVAKFWERNGATIKVFESLPDRPNLVRIRPHELFCDTTVKGRCVVHERGLPIYRDDDHLSQLGSNRVGAVIMDAL